MSRTSVTLWDNIKRSNTGLIGVSEGEDRIGKKYSNKQLKTFQLGKRQKYTLKKFSNLQALRKKKKERKPHLGTSYLN